MPNIHLLFEAINGYIWNHLSHETIIATVQNAIGESPIASIYLVIPAFVGLMIVGSFERRISFFFRTENYEKNNK